MAAIVGAAVLSGASGAAAAPAPQTGPSSERFTSLDQLAQSVAAAPDDLGGMWINPQTGAVTVNQVAGHASATATTRISQVQDGRIRRPVAYRSVAHSYSMLQRILDEVSTNRSWAPDLDRRLAVWYIDAATNGVVIGVTKPTPQLARAATAAFGPAVRVVQHDRFASMVSIRRVPAGQHVELAHHAAAKAPTDSGVALATAPTRLLDAQPYYGGDRIASVQTINGVQYQVQCTAGFTFTFSSGPAMMTAGHCGAVGTTWYQGYFSGSTLNYTGTMGVVNSRQWGNNRPDGETLKAAGTSYSPFVYTSTTASTAVTGTVPLVQGEGVCADGSFTGQNCSGQITNANTCVNESDDSGVVTHVCSLAIADSANQTKLVGPGDSGGPVYVGSNLKAEGVVSGGSSTGVELLFARIDTLQSTFGGTVAHT